MAILSGVYFFFEKKTNITVYVSYYFSDINVTILMNFTFSFILLCNIFFVVLMALLLFF